MKSSIRNKLWFYILTVTTLFMMGIGVLNYFWAQRLVVNLSEEKASAMADKASASIAVYLLQKGQYAWTMAQDEQIHRFVEGVDSRYQNLSDDQDYRQLLTTFKRIVNRDPDIIEAYIAVEKTQRIYDATEYENPPDYIVQERPWYKAAVNTKGLAFTSPYICPVTGKRVVTASVPFYNSKGDLLGVACVDILADKVQNIVNNVHLFKSGFAFVVDDKGVIIIHPDSRFYMKTLTDEKVFGLNYKPLASKMINAETGIEKLQKDNEEKYVFYSPIPQMKWSLGVVVPVSEITEPIYTLGRLSFATIVLGILIISILLAVLTARIIQPIKEFTRLMRKVEEGDYTVRAQIQSDDEVGRLGQSLNRLLNKQHRLIENVTNIANKMGVAGHELAINFGEARSTLPVVHSLGKHITSSDNVLEKNRITQESQVFTDFMEKVVHLNFRNRMLLSMMEEIDPLLNEDDELKDFERQEKLWQHIRSNWHAISEELVSASELAENVQMAFVDVADNVENMDGQFRDIINALQVFSKQVDNVSSIQADVLDRARVTSMSLVSWSQDLLKITAPFNVSLEEGDGKECGPRAEIEL